MADELYTGTILDFSVVKPPNQTNFNTVVPYFDGVRLMSGEHTQLSLRPPYFGDTVNLGFWKTMRIDIGSSDFSHSLYDLVSGYQYIFNYSRKRFTVIDDNGSIVETIYNVKSIADMNISFDVYKSHQFIIQLESYDTVNPFFIPVLYERLGAFYTILDFSVVKPPNQTNFNTVVPYFDGVRLMGGEDYFSAISKQVALIPYIEMSSLDCINLSLADYLDMDYLPIICYIYDILFNGNYFYTEFANNSVLHVGNDLEGVTSFDIDFLDVYGTNYFYLGTLEPLQLWLGENIIPPPSIDPDKCYDEGDFWAGNPYIVEDTRESITYVVYSNPDCCESSAGTGIGRQLVVVIHSLDELQAPVLGVFYKKGSVIEYYKDGFRRYYLVNRDLYLTNMDFEGKSFNSICLLLLQVVKEKVFVATELYISWLLPMWSLTLYLMLQPVIRDGETQNNRPVYEPWMIWGFYKFIYSRAIDDIMDYLHEVPTWDLSPSWG